MYKISDTIRHELEKYKQEMRKREYVEATVTGYQTYLSRFLRHQIESVHLDVLKETIRAFLEAERTDCPQTYKECRAALRLYYHITVGGSLKENPKPPPLPAIAALLQRFHAYSREIKHLEEDTIISEINHTRGFLEFAFGRSPQVAANALTAEDIRNYVVKQLDRLADSSKGRIITSIRNFFRCQSFYGEPVHSSIFRLPLSPAVWRKSAFPTTINAAVFNSLHMLPDCDTEIGKRNRCIILCFTELALRCSEVATLTLDDFHWHGGYVTIRKTKNGSDRTLPLPTMLGNALAEYLTHVRPETACRSLFIRFKHTRGEPMGCGQIRGVIRRNSAKAGLEDRAGGTHILRRTAATQLYNAGNSLKLTADVLGHESLDSTTHYTKTDMAGLKLAAAPWPGGAQ
jgi:site-specific recombinase XerD